MTDTIEEFETPVASMPKYRWISRSAQRENEELRRYLDNRIYDKLEHALDLTERLMKSRYQTHDLQSTS